MGPGVNGRRRPLVVEVVGPAGVGKTTLTVDLEARGRAVRGTMWFLPKPLLAQNTLRQVPRALAWYRDTGALLWQEVKHLARLDALHAFLHQYHWNGTRLVILDEGPVYVLSWLQVQGHEYFRSRPDAWWRAALERWARSLDAVVVLDAPDSVLASRIRRREKPHLMKDRSAAEVSAFLEAYRVASEHVLRCLEAAGGPPVLRLGVADDPKRLGDRFLAALDQGVDAH